MTIRDACFPQDRDLVVRLFREYEASLKLDLSFQNFEQELASLPGLYAPPGGALLLANESGCVAMRPLEPHICEMKRLYVSPEGRGSGTGRALIAAILERSRQAGYRSIRLDTLPFMQSAVQLYRNFGFQQIPQYRENPVPGALFFELRL